MGIETQLRDEDGEVLGEVSDVADALSNATDGALSGTRLLKYLQPYNDAVFNQAQAADLRDDMNEVLRKHAGTPLARVLEDVAPLVDKLAAEAHVYLWFVGD
jgi:hypothetical protein